MWEFGESDILQTQAVARITRPRSPGIRVALNLLSDAYVEAVADRDPVQLLGHRSRNAWSSSGECTHVTLPEILSDKKVLGRYRVE